MSVKFCMKSSASSFVYYFDSSNIIFHNDYNKSEKTFTNNIKTNFVECNHTLIEIVVSGRKQDLKHNRENFKNFNLLRSRRYHHNQNFNSIDINFASCEEKVKAYSNKGLKAKGESAIKNLLESTSQQCFAPSEVSTYNKNKCEDDTISICSIYI